MLKVTVLGVAVGKGAGGGDMEESATLSSAILRGGEGKLGIGTGFLLDTEKALPGALDKVSSEGGSLDSSLPSSSRTSSKS